MFDIFIKYNPYTLKTEVKIDGEPVATDSALFIEDGKHLQEWIDELPDKIKRVCNEREASITFHGTTPDFDDLQSVAEAAKADGVLLDCKHEQSNGTEDKIPVIKQIFEDIKKCPYDEFAELTAPKVCELFEEACNSDSTVHVVATMSAGKSTLINALLGCKLMPSKYEACTATITEIRDCGSDTFRAMAYDKEGTILEGPVEQMTYQDMQRLNDTPSVSVIKIEGNVPFMQSKEMSLVLVDTPGPNNARDGGIKHCERTFEALESPMTLVLYILNATNSCVNDDSYIFGRVVEKIKEGGKLSRDRFIFVFNQVDNFKKGEDSVEVALKNIRDYLKGKGIENPNVFPASALTALYIRTILHDIDPQTVDNDAVDDDDTEEALKLIRKLNRNDDLHLEDYAPLPANLRHEINRKLDEAQNAKDVKSEALIHTGIVSIEAAIKLYVEKYSKTAKIKRLVDVFYPKLKSTVAIEDLKREILTNEESARNIQENIDAINAKLQRGDEARRLKERLAGISYTEEIERLCNEIFINAQGRITMTINENRGKKLTIAQSKSEVDRLSRFMTELQANVKVDLETVVNDHVRKNASSLLDEYKRSLSELVQDLNVKEVIVDPLKLMEGTIDIDGLALIDSLKRTERVKTGQHKVRNTKDKAWLDDPSTWLNVFKFANWSDETPDYKTVYEYEDQDFVDCAKLDEGCLVPLEKDLRKKVDEAQSFAESLAEEVKKDFSKKFDQLDELLKKKLAMLKECEDDKRNKERVIAAAKEVLERQTWLEDIRTRVEKILEV